MIEQIWSADEGGVVLLGITAIVLCSYFLLRAGGANNG